MQKIHYRYDLHEKILKSVVWIKLLFYIVFTKTFFEFQLFVQTSIIYD
jgi:hypothetical protein